MRKNLGAKPYMFPQPVLILAAYNEDGSVNAMNAAWGGIADTNQVAVYVSAAHKTLANILSYQAFTISMADEAHVKACDYVGLVSGNKEPMKFEKAGFHYLKSEVVNAPLIEELPMALECRLIHFDEESELLLGEIVNVSIDERVFDDQGKFDPKKLAPIVFDPVNHTYWSLGKQVGRAFHDGNELKS